MEMLKKSEMIKKKQSSAMSSIDGSRISDEIQALRKSISHKSSKIKPKALPNDSQDKRTSSSIWNWKPLKALSHIRRRRFNCRFTLRVHSINGLDQNFNGSTIIVRWKRNIAELGLCTRPGRVHNGIARFEESLEHRCHVYGSRGGGPHHTAKYEARYFVLYASVVGSPEIDLGKHRVDLTRLLPLNFDELDLGSSGKWSTSFKLLGKGKNALLNVSFGFSIVDDGDFGSSSGKKQLSVRRVESPLSKSLSDGSYRPVEDSKLENKGWGDVDEHSCGKKQILMRRVGSPLSRSLSDVSYRNLADLKDVSPIPTLENDHSAEKKQRSMRRVGNSFSKSLSHVPLRNVENLNNVSPISISEIEDLRDGDDHSAVKKQIFVRRLGSPLSKRLSDVSYRNYKDLAKVSPISIPDIHVEDIPVGKKQRSVIKVANSLSKSLSDVSYRSVEYLSDVSPSSTSEIEDLCEDDDHSAVRIVGNPLFRSLSDVPSKTVEDQSNVSMISKSKIEVWGDVEDHFTVKDMDPIEVIDIEEFFLQEESMELAERGSDGADHQESAHYGNTEDFGDYIRENEQTQEFFDFTDQEECISDDELLWNELEAALENLPIFGSVEYEDQNFEEQSFEGSSIVDSGFDDGLDEVTDTVSSEFFDMLGIADDPDPDSPKERLWQEFKNKSLVNFEGNFDLEEEEERELNEYDHDDDEGHLDLSSLIHAAEEEHQGVFNNESLEYFEGNFDLEEEQTHFGDEDDNDEECLDLSSLIHAAEEEHEEATRALNYKEYEEVEALMHELSKEKIGLPPIDEQPELFLRTKNGGYLRSMNSSISPNSKENGSLIMQVSSPVVLPAEMGSNAVEILQFLASMGIEKLSLQASQLMPLEEISGKSIQQVFWEAADVRSAANQRDPMKIASSSDNYVSLEELAPLAMEKIEALSIQGLQTQSELLEDESPAGKKYQSTNGSVGIHLPQINGHDQASGLIDLSVSLTEWLRLDSTSIRSEKISDRTARILSAHHAGSRKWGPLGDAFTVGLMVQIRDPIRGFKPVGAPMLSLVQVERLIVPPRPRLYYTVSDEGNSEESEEEPKVNAVNDRFTITEVHVASLTCDSGDRKRRIWTGSGSRWIIAKGMCKPNKHPLLRSAQSRSFWRVSSWVNGVR